MVTSPRYKPVHDNAYMKTYALLEEMGKPISFHAAYNWDDRALAMTNRFISVHALGFMWFNMVHMTNWVINGLPERFPKLKTMWIESGLTWAYCLMQRLDHSYMMRTSDCPSLKRKPSEYMREMYYSSQPMEVPEDLSILEATFKMIKAETQLVWSSDYPHWDFDLPSMIYDLPFLKETGQAQHPRRQRGAAVQSRSEAGEEDSVGDHSEPAMPACSTTLPQRKISELTNRASASGAGVTSGDMPRATNSFCTEASPAIVRKSALSRVTMASGVFAGATNMCQAEAS